MSDNLKRVIELANQLQEAVNDCKDCICVEINNKRVCETPGVHVSAGILDQLQSVEQVGEHGNLRWFGTNRYGIRIFGIVEDCACGEEQ